MISAATVIDAASGITYPLTAWRRLRRFGPATVWLRRWLWCVSLLSLLLAHGVASAQVLAEQDARAVRTVVEAQLEAFVANDAARAFAYASPSIQAQFGDAATFMAMVRAGYPMMVRPATVSFFQARVVDGTEAVELTVRQAVNLRDPEGRLWMATYLLERRVGTGWRINGCMVVADSGKSLT